jgi:hypothetical protein
MVDHYGLLCWRPNLKKPAMFSDHGIMMEMDSQCMFPIYNRNLLTSSQAPPLLDQEQACTLANPHSSAYIDIDGDCLPGQLLLLFPGKLMIRSRATLLNSSVGRTVYSDMVKSRCRRI